MACYYKDNSVIKNTHNRQAGDFIIHLKIKQEHKSQKPMPVQAESGQKKIFQPNIPSSALIGELGGVDVSLGPLGSSKDSTCCSGSGKKSICCKEPCPHQMWILQEEVVRKQTENIYNLFETKMHIKKKTHLMADNRCENTNVKTQKPKPGKNKIQQQKIRKFILTSH